MSDKFRQNRKASDQDIVNLNNIGLSLRSIGERLGVHHSSVKTRLESLNIPPADTRRAFMEDIYDGLTPGQQEWLGDQLDSGRPIKSYVRELIIAHHARQTSNMGAAA